MRSRVLLAVAVGCLTLPTAASADPAAYVRPLSGTLGAGFPMVGASVPFMPGNDDTATMSAWYVLAALGLYHAAPGSQAWELSSPAFEHAVVRLGGNRKLTIDASGASRLRKYIQSAQFDGKPFDHTWLPSQKLHSGGRLSFVMGAQPAPSWAAAPGAAPPGL